MGEEERIPKKNQSLENELYRASLQETMTHSPLCVKSKQGHIWTQPQMLGQLYNYELLYILMRGTGMNET